MTLALGPRAPRSQATELHWPLMILLLLFLQKQSLAFAVYLFGKENVPNDHLEKKTTMPLKKFKFNATPWQRKRP
jgi:hypothetical protein